MSDFRKQIEEDIRGYQDRYPNIEQLQKEEWAFNFWILDKFFYEEDELILDKIIDYKDRGVDAYEWYEDTKELYIIQNKYYTNTRLTAEYVNNNFLVAPISALEKGTYVRSEELQNIYTQNKNSDKFTVHLQIYVTNNLKSADVAEAIKDFNAEHSPKFIAEVFYLSDIEAKWYGEPKKSAKQLKVQIESVNGGTVLNVNNDAYHLENSVDAKYVFTPITCIYRMMKAAQEKCYPLFEKNIREYLGNKGINKNIYKTLKDKEDRKNFFYYNNGITLICDKIGSFSQINNHANPHINISFSIDNPQIVNGCQTVNSIFTALKEYDEDDLEAQFKDTFVMLKVLEIDKGNPVETALSKNIVTFNNSQNSIDEKTFVANNELFQRIKVEFEDKGFLLIIKQSDSNTFKDKYQKQSDLIKLRGKSSARRHTFGLENLKTVADFQIPLEKLLQVVLAFKEGGLSAYTLKKDVLKPDTVTYNTVVEFIRSSNITTEVLLNLYLLFLRAEKEKKINSKNSSKEGKFPTPIPFYLIDGFAKFECGERDNKKILENLDSRQKVDYLLKLYSFVCASYAKKYTKTQNIDYTKMIKKDIDYHLLGEEREEKADMMKMMSIN